MAQTLAGTCKDCKHNYKISDGRSKLGRAGWLNCDRWFTGYALDPAGHAPNEVMLDDSTGWGGFAVGPDFGCVLFEAKVSE